MRYSEQLVKFHQPCIFREGLSFFPVRREPVWKYQEYRNTSNSYTYTHSVGMLVEWIFPLYHLTPA